MRYLVIVESIEGGASPPQQNVQMIENVLLPTLEALVKLEAERKILAGGAFVGPRGGAYIVEAESNSEVSQLLMGLPMWGMSKWTVTPLVGVEERVTYYRQKLESLKASK